MPITLSDVDQEPEILSPDIALFYGVPKVGKTGKGAELPDKMFLDGEGGSRMYKTKREQFRTYEEFYDILDAIEGKAAQRMKEGKTGEDIFPHKFLILDTIDKVEEIAIESLTEEYVRAEMKKLRGDKPGCRDPLVENPHFLITDKPFGSGHNLVRNRVKKMMLDAKRYCQKLIVFGHVRDKEISEVNNVLVQVKELALMGKLATIICANVDVIGYMYRDKVAGVNKLMVSFETYEKASMGSRFTYLAGKKMEFDWKLIYPDMFPE